MYFSYVKRENWEKMGQWGSKMQDLCNLQNFVFRYQEILIKIKTNSKWTSVPYNFKNHS